MKRIVFVCHGNICRSPMAEFIFKKMIRDKGLSDCFEIISRATSDEEIIDGRGEPIYPNAKAELTKNGIPFEERAACQLKRADYDAYDLFIGMDHTNYRNMHLIFGVAPKDEKIRLLMDYTNRPGEVSDPWFSRRFDIAYRDIYEGCEGLLRTLLS